MLSWSILLLLVWHLPQLAIAKNSFLIPYWTAKTSDNPKGQLVWELGSTQTVSVDTTWSEFRIELWQVWAEGDGADLASTLIANQSAGEVIDQTFQWEVQTYDLTLERYPTFLMFIRNNESNESQSSAEFNITREEVSSTTLPASSTTGTSTGITTAAISTTSGTNQISANTQESSSSSSLLATSAGDISNNGLSTGAKAGIGVGAAAGGIILFSAIWYMGWRARGNRGTAATARPTENLYNDKAVAGSDLQPQRQPKSYLSAFYQAPSEISEAPGHHSVPRNMVQPAELMGTEISG